MLNRFLSPRQLDGVVLGAFALGFLVLRFVYLLFYCPYGLAPDEAQYWHWLVRPDLSYVTKPPLTTWMMGLTTYLWGDTMWGVRAFAVFSQSVMPLLGAWVAYEIAPAPLKRRALWWSFALLATVPLVAAAGMIMSPDVLLTPLWMLALGLMVRFLKREKTPWWEWVLLGGVVGLGGLAKYTAVFFFPLVGVYALVYRRDLLKEPGLYVAGVIALLMQFPVLYWNMTHDWLGVKHVLWQSGDNDDPRWGDLPSLWNFVSGQWGVVGPLIFPLLLGAWWHGARREKVLTEGERFLWWMSFPIFAAFLVQSLDSKVQPNWPVLATLPGLVLVGVMLARFSFKRWLVGVAVGGMLLSGGVSLLLYNTQWLRDAHVPLRVKIDPTKDMMGWKEAGDLTAVLLSQLQPGTMMLASRYQTVAELAFHVPAVASKPALFSGRYGGKVHVLYANPGGKRMTEYDLWPWPDMKNRLVLYVSEQEGIPDAIQARFSRCEPWQKAQIIAQGNVVRMMYYSLCWNVPPKVSEMILHP